VDKSVETIKQNFEGIKIAGFHHGYIKDCKDSIVQEIKDSGARVVIIGMGAPMQDEMAVLLKRAGFVGSVYTCGGFIHQTQDTMVSFPTWTNKLGLRWLYRLFTQKGMVKRLIETYPKFVVTYSRFLSKMK
jgi:exopolysaccharide biosynthesis WecB/TagA/CpsF family protein